MPHFLRRLVVLAVQAFCLSGVLLWLFAPFLVVAQPLLSQTKQLTQFTFHTWTVADGLPHTQINAITQDEKGYLWLGTSNGLAKFDGKEFQTTYQSATKNDFSLPSNEISCLLSLQNASQNELWIGTFYAGIAQKKQAQFRTFTKRNLLDERILALTKWENSVWIITPNGLSRYRRDVFRHYTEKDGLESQPQSIHNDKNENLWIGTTEGLFQFDLDSNKAVLAHEQLQQSISSIASDNKGNLWLVANQNQLIYWNRIEQKIEYIESSAFTNTKISTLFIDTAGSLWIGTNSKGLSRYALGKFEFLNKDNGLNDNFVRCIFQDNEGSLWIGLDKMGLVQLSESKFLNIGVHEGITSDETTCIFIDDNQNKWIGSSQKGLFIKQSNGQTQHFELDAPISSIAGNEHRVILGTNSRGLFEFTNHQLKPLSATTSLRHINNIVLSKKNSNQFWISTPTGIFTLESNKLTLLTSELTSYNLSALAENDLFLGVASKENGFFLIENAYQNPIIFNLTTQDNLPSNTVLSVFEHNGAFYIGTTKGFAVYQDNQLFVPKPFNQWTNSAIHAIQKIGEVWYFTTNHGIFSFKNKDFEDWIKGKSPRIDFNSYDESDGMRSASCAKNTFPNLSMAADSSIWIPTKIGISIFQANQQPIALPRPNVAIESIIDAQKKNWISAFSDTAPVIFSSDLNSFEISFDALTFNSPEKVRFRYKLEGYDDSWQETQLKSIFYGDLPPKQYKFIVLAANRDGIWNEEGAKIYFRIRPHITQTIWFWLGVVLLCFIFGFSIYRWRIKAIQIQNKKLEKQVESRTEELIAQTAQISSQANELEIIDKIVASVNKEVTFENVLNTLLLQALTLLNDTNKGYFLYYESDYFYLAVPHGYTHRLPERFSFDKVISYFKSGLPLARYFYKVYPSDREYLLKPYVPKYSLVIPILINHFPEAILVFDFDKERSFSQAERRQLQRFTEHAVSSFLKARAFREVNEQKEKLEDTVSHLSDSINYAFRIQQAILKKPSEIKSHFEEAMIFYRPRDIVSGDFYWFYHHPQTHLITFAIIDCTGHGVPGAFMTVMANSILNQIIKEKRIEDPAQILQLLDEQLEQTFAGDEKRKDGMDIGIMVVDKAQHTLRYAGAKLDLCLIRNNQIEQIKATRYPIGHLGHNRVIEKGFQTHTISYQKDDYFYLYTDGFPDQFGGEENRKFLSRKFREFLLEYHYLSAEEQEEKLATALTMWKGNLPQTDDILVVGIKT